MKVSKKLPVFAAALALATASAAHGSMFITEYMYNGNGAGSIGEFVEFTNAGSTPVDMTGWGFDDNHRLTQPLVSLSGFGTVAPGQSVILTDDTAASFRTNWGLPASVEIIGGNTANLGRSDEINLYDSGNNLIDELTYNDQGTGNVKGPRANGVSANILPANYGANNASLTVSSVAGDSFGSHTSSLLEVGSPGGPVPEPSSLCLLGGAAAMLMRRWRSL